MRIPLRYVFAGIQFVLLSIANYIDLREHHGMGEGMNQVYANWISNIEFLIKVFLNVDDIVNYNFHFIIAIASVGIWFLIGWGIDRIVKRNTH